YKAQNVETNAHIAKLCFVMFPMNSRAYLSQIKKNSCFDSNEKMTVGKLKIKKTPESHSGVFK
ncbi:MAG: hypothetical protein WBQ67_01945, partial [Acinetobacter sp.]